MITSNQLTRWIVAVTSIILILLVAWWLAKPWLLMQQYGTELRESLLRHVEIIGTAGGQQDPAVMAQVTTGKSLASSIEFRCKKCPTLLINKKADVKVLQVLGYSVSSSEVIARVEVGWYPVSTETSTITGGCHAQAYTIHVILQKEDGVWKVAEGKEVDADRVDDSPELRALYCGSD